jgi:hypothetical protein
MALGQEQFHDLLYQTLETELGGAQIYRAALGCARNDDLRKEWEDYLHQTTRHVELSEGALRAFGLDLHGKTPGRRVVRQTGRALVKAIERAQAKASPEEAQLVAAECVTLAETKDHLNWELIGEVVNHLTGGGAKVLRAAHSEVTEQESQHLYHNTGWARELWMEGLGLRAVLPPPEDQRDVKTAIGAARAKNARRELGANHRATRVANASKASSHGGKRSRSGANTRPGGTAAPQHTAGRRGRKRAAAKS